MIINDYQNYLKRRRKIFSGGILAIQLGRKSTFLEDLTHFLIQSSHTDTLILKEYLQFSFFSINETTESCGNYTASGKARF